MFGKRIIQRLNEFKSEIEGLFERIERLGRDFFSHVESQKVDLELLEKKGKEEVGNLVGRVNNDVERRLIEFHKEIVDKYFDTLEKILRFGKEISVIDSLAHRVTDQDFARLKKELMAPFLETRWQEKRKEEGKQVEEGLKSFGEEILQKRQELYDNMLKKEREGHDVGILKEQIALLDWIIRRKNE